MKLHYKIIHFLACSWLLLSSVGLLSQSNKPYQFISPRPASIMVSSGTNIVLRHSSLVDRESLSSERIEIQGSLSGVHGGELLLSDDRRTIVFNPDIAFAAGEIVSVSLTDGVRTMSGSVIPKFSYTFSTAPGGIVQISNDVFQDHEVLKSTAAAEAFLPPPPITIDSIDNPSDGYIFMATWDRNMPALYGNFIFILDKNGALVDSVRVDGAPYDFQVQPNGLLSYALGDFAANVPLPGEELQHMVLDESLAVVDSFKMKNGYITDFHCAMQSPRGGDLSANKTNNETPH